MIRRRTFKGRCDFDTKQDAINAAREISRNQGTELYIHGKDGKSNGGIAMGTTPIRPEDRYWSLLR